MTFMMDKLKIELLKLTKMPSIKNNLLMLNRLFSIHDLNDLLKVKLRM